MTSLIMTHLEEDDSYPIAIVQDYIRKKKIVNKALLEECNEFVNNLEKSCLEIIDFKYYTEVQTTSLYCCISFIFRIPHVHQERHFVVSIRYRFCSRLHNESNYHDEILSGKEKHQLKNLSNHYKTLVHKVIRKQTVT